MKFIISSFISRYERFFPYVVFVVALSSMVGSLVLSELVHLVPCVLCWYQRILMYPLVAIIAVGILRHDRNWVFYVLPLSLLGAVVAAYHSLLQWGILSEAIIPCNAAVSCAVKEVNILGFITIPFLSFLAFAAISAITGMCIRAGRASLAR